MKYFLYKRIKKFLWKAVPMWMLLVLLLNSSMIVGITQYWIMKRNFNNSIVELSKTTKNPEELVLLLKQEVFPQNGYILGAEWKDIGIQLIKSGVIDEQKYNELFKNDSVAQKHMWHLANTSSDHMTINEQDAHFMVNTLWALGLVNKSKILEEGSMKQYGNGDFMSYASTGGWNLGSKPTLELYSSTEIITLTLEQEKLVEKIAKNVYRPCCGNHTEFPDCNHGMAALGYIQLAVKQGVSERRIYQDLLALNSFWFPQNYVELAVYLQNQGTKWKTVDPQIALASEYSSAQGAQQVRQSVQNIPGLQIQGGGCGT